jgi:hypothetical protein
MTSRPEDTDDAPHFEDDDMFSHRERIHERRPRVSDFVRRAIENTVGSVQTTGVLSKEALTYLLQQGDRGKKELVRIIANEVGEFLRGIDLSGEIVKVLSSVQLEVTASVRFKRTGDKGVKPVVSDANVQVQTAPSAPPASDAPPTPSDEEDVGKPPPAEG